jgi:hypothetical protein
MPLIIDETGSEIVADPKPEIQPYDLPTLDDDKFYVIKDLRHGKRILMKLPGVPIVDVTKYARDLYIDANGTLQDLELNLRGRGKYIHITRGSA